MDSYALFGALNCPALPKPRRITASEIAPRRHSALRATPPSVATLHIITSPVFLFALYRSSEHFINNNVECGKGS